jgi:regulator of ribonuclease activity A
MPNVSCRASTAFFVLGCLTMTSACSVTFSTCDFCDLYKDDLSGDFRVLSPLFKDYGGASQFHGEVVTVKCHEDNTPVKQAVDRAGLGRVLVVDGGSSLRRALLGGNLAANAARNGWAGLVIDGCVRDLAELRASHVGIRALAHVPLPTVRQQPGQTGIPVLIQGVVVRPGEWLYADEDGIVVYPIRLQKG